MTNKYMKEKRGLSPVIATMLLVAIVVVLGLIIFLWFKGISEEAITKFDGTNVKLVCEDVQFDASYNNNQVFILNLGNVPIYKMKVMKISDGSHTTEVIGNGWPEFGLMQGGAFQGLVSGSSNKIVLIPVLLGHSDRGDIPYTCDERHGYELITA
jgi:flagellin-like protein